MTRERQKMKVKVDNWHIQYRKRGETVCTIKDGVEQKSMSADMFEYWGMVKFPKELYNLITSSLTNSNTYDRFLDKFYAEREKS
jgi:hypothetical protein